MARRILILVLILGVLGLVAGCSNNGVSPNNTNNSKIAAEFGGYTPTNEMPYFGNPTIEAALGSDRPFDDNVVLPPALDSLLNDSTAGAFAVRIVWGHLTFDSNGTATTWDGSLKLSRGAEMVRRTINFEPGDYILPRTDPTLIQWVSKTTVFNDGILVNLFVPRADTLDTTAATLTFDTAPFKITFRVSDLNSLDTVFTLPDSEAVAFHATRLTFRECPKGFLSGFWGTDSLGNGIFFGNWMAFNGVIMGTVDGKWGIPDSTGKIQNIFVGKFIDLTGKFQGLLKGAFVMNADFHASDMGKMRGGGRFRGQFFDGNGNPLGNLRGKFKSAPRNAAMGFFQGHWNVICPEAPGDSDNDIGDMHNDMGDMHGEGDD